MIYRPEIDGLRALSVLAVLFFHSGADWISGGFVGVDIFFVISGFLICGIITREVEDGTFTFKDFYDRRFRRIFPALFVVVASTIFVGSFILLPSQLEELGASSAAAIFGISNFFFMNRVGYFSPETELMPLVHTWSLGVEEQFYFFAPALIVLFLKISHTALKVSFLAVALLSFGFAVSEFSMSPQKAFFFSPFRFWEIMIGGLCAVLCQNSMRRIWNEIFSVIGLACIIFSFFYFDKDQQGSYVLLSLPVLGSALVIFSSQGTSVAKLLSLRPLVYVGLLSYSAYLWHQPVFAFARALRLDVTEIWSFTYLFMLISLLSIATRSLVEQPFRRRGRASDVQHRSAFRWVLVCCLLVLTFGAILKLSDGLPSRFTEIPVDDPTAITMPRLENGYCFYSVDDNESLQIGAGGLKCLLGDSVSPKSNILLFGDSFAGHWDPFWDSFGKENSASVFSVTTNWCNPSFSEDFVGPENSRAHKQCLVNREFVKRNLDQFDIIVLSGMWTAGDVQALMDDFKSTLEMILVNSKARIVVMPSPIGLPEMMLERIRYLGVQELKISDVSKLEHDATYQKLIETSMIDGRISVIDPNHLFGDFAGSRGILDRDSRPYTFDGAHLSIYGALSAFANFRASSSYAEIAALASH